MWIGLIMKDVEWFHVGQNFKEERICFEGVKIVEIQIGVE